MTPLHGVDDADRDQQDRRLSHGGTEDQPAEVNAVTGNPCPTALLCEEDFERQGVRGQPAHQREGREREGESQPSSRREAGSEKLSPPCFNPTGEGSSFGKEAKLLQVPWVCSADARFHHPNRQRQVEPYHRNQHNDRTWPRFRPDRQSAQPLTGFAHEVHQREKPNRCDNGRTHERQGDDRT